jgi:hypothetical protein
MDWMERLKGGLEHLEQEGTGALTVVQDDVMSFLDQVKQHLTRNPEPVFAVLRRLKPVLIVKNTALVHDTKTCRKFWRATTCFKSPTKRRWRLSEQVPISSWECRTLPSMSATSPTCERSSGARTYPLR